MEYNSNIAYEDLSSELKQLIDDVIDEIRSNIDKYNIDIQDLSKELSMDYEVLTDYIIHPKNDYSGYLDILDAINNMLGR